ncbi:MAG TPA: (Fe-S)-binding protein, partial [Bacteroidota bacterium]|nr:(Fe-S)-binding protein [Bacteroidota bacterium]
MIKYLSIGKSEKRTDKPFDRLRNVAVIAFGQTKLFREPLAGLMHFCIFWGFVILLLAIIESLGEGINPGFTLSFLGVLYPPLIFLQDVFGILVIGSCLFALVRRHIFKPARLDVDRHAKIDATIILVIILLIMCSMFLQNAAYISRGIDKTSESRFLSCALASIFENVPEAQQEFWLDFFWWFHILLVLGFLNYLPFSKHLHILSSIPNVYLAKLDARGTLQALNLQDEKATRFGVADVEDLTWKNLLDGYTCTECGRCTASCPAAITGKPLSPKKIIVDVRQRLMEKGPLAVSGVTLESLGEIQGNGKHPLQKQLIDDYITEDELWACTTCMACVQECPVMIEHVDAI